MKNKKLFELLLCVVLTINLLATSCSGGETPPASLDEPAQSEDDGNSSTGTAAQLGSMKSFTAATLDGGSFTQEDIATKDVTVVNYWSLTCGPCIAEMPDLAAFENALPDNVRLVTVCLDGTGAEDIVKGILSEAGYEGMTLLSGDGDYLEIWKNLQYTPTTVLVDNQGNLVGDAIIGGQKDLSATFLSAVNAALKASGKAEISLEK